MEVKKITLFLLFQFLLLPLIFGQKVLEKQVYFASDQYELSKEAKADLDELINESTQASVYSFQVKGHTDKDGSHIYNEKLSHKRSEAVKNYLLHRGIAAAQIDLAAFGERQPITIQDDPNAKAMNRRVEVILNYDIIESVEEMYAHFAKKQEQHFTFNLDQPSSLRAKDGTIVKIPANAFVHPDGRSLEGQLVNLKIEEAIRPSAMVFNQLNTVHGENALTTGGMIRLTASVDGVPLELKNGKAIDVFVPTTDANPAMNLYSGSRDEAGRMEWDQLEEPIQILDAATVLEEPAVFPKEILSALDGFEQEISAHPGKLKDLPLPALLKRPEPLTKRISKPYRPGLPKRQIAKEPDGLFAKMRYDQVKAQKALDKQYEKRMQQYEKRVVAYEEALKAYTENEKVYQAELAVIEKQFLRDNHEVIAKRREMVSDYFEKCYAFEASIRLNNKLDGFRKDLDMETIHEKLNPKFNSKKADAFFFNYSLVAAEYMVKGEQMPRWEDALYSEYRLNVNRAADKLMAKSGYFDAIYKVKKAYKAYQNKKALELKKQSNVEYARLDEQIKYYGFKITQPTPFWCNIDTPIPMGKELLVFENASYVELFTFCPKQKTVNYFPINIKKSALFETGEKVSYIAFQFVNDKVQLAKGNVLPTRRAQVGLDFEPSSLAAVEEAILALDL